MNYFLLKDRITYIKKYLAQLCYKETENNVIWQFAMQ